MALVLFESRVNMLTVATPSIGGYVIGYDSTDGILKQKNDQGVIIPIAGSNSAGTLSQTLERGSSTGIYSISLGASCKLGSVLGGGQLRLDNGVGGINIVNLSTDYGALLQSYLFMNNNSVTLRSINSSLLLNSTSASFQFNNSNIISFNSTDCFINLNGRKVLFLTTGTSSTDNSDKAGVIVSSSSSRLATGANNTVILGGSNIIGATANSVYVPNIYIKDGGFIKGTSGLGQLKFTDIDESLLLSDDKVFGIISSSSSLSNYNGVFMVDTDNSFTTPSINHGVIYLGSYNTTNDSGLSNVIVIGGNTLGITQSNRTYIGGSVSIGNNYLLPSNDGVLGQVIQTDGNGNTFWGNLVGEVTEITAASFSTLNGTFEPNMTYKILDADSSLYGGTEIYLTTNSSGVLNESGVGKFYNPKYDKVISGFYVWSDVGSYGISDFVFWGGFAWSNSTGTNSDPSIDIFTLSGSEWDLITFDSPFSDFYYNIAYDEIKYDWLNDFIIYRNEKNSNIVSTSVEDINYWVDEYGYSPIKVFQWGNTYDYSLSKGIGNNRIINSYNENINFSGLYQKNINFINGSYQRNINFINASYQNTINFNRGWQQNITLDNSYQYFITIKNDSHQTDIILGSSSTQGNLLIDNSSSQSDIQLYSSNQLYLNFDNSSSQTSLILDTTDQNNIRLENYTWNRNGDTITTNENDLTFIKNKHLFGNNDFNIDEALSNINIKGTLNYTLPNTATFSVSGEVVYYGGIPYGLTAGYLYANVGGTWSAANNINRYSYQLGIALGTTPSIDGILINGFIHSDHVMYSGTVGSPQYISATNSEFTEFLPVSDYVRVIGHIVQNNILHFNPDNIWLKITNFEL